MGYAADSDCDRNLGFLVCDISRLVRRMFNSRARNTGLTQPQWQAMFTISHNPGINQVSLADLLEIHPITLTQQLDRMQAAGWVERRPDPNDRRATCLFITTKGKPVLEKLLAIGANVIDVGFGTIDAKLREKMVDTLLAVRNRYVAADTAKPGKSKKRPAKRRAAARSKTIKTSAKR
jgi:MarR family transcriptional regulator, transcriptional regulator for hemolysin